MREIEFKSRIKDLGYTCDESDAGFKILKSGDRNQSLIAKIQNYNGSFEMTISRNIYEIESVDAHELLEIVSRYVKDAVQDKIVKTSMMIEHDKNIEQARELLTREGYTVLKREKRDETLDVLSNLFNSLGIDIDFIEVKGE